MKTYRLMAGAVLLLTSMALPAVADAQAQESGPVFELRTYTATPGNRDALLARFRDHTVALFEKHGMTNVGYWIPADAGEETLIYVVAHASQEAAAASWRAFATDPEWRQVNEASNRDGPILQSVERVYMTATDFSQLQ